MSSELRCAAHPSRPASDNCPNCGRPRCASDASSGGQRCLICRSAEARRRPKPTPAERAIRAGLAAYAIAIIGAEIGTQYVRVHIFSLVVPGAVGIGCCWAAASAGGGRRLPTTLGIVASLLSVALSDRLNAGGGYSPFTPIGQAGPPYLAALIGVALWPVILGPPKPKPGPED